MEYWEDDFANGWDPLDDLLGDDGFHVEHPTGSVIKERSGKMKAEYTKYSN